MWYNHYNDLVVEFFFTPHRSSVPFRHVLATPPFPQPLVTSNLLSVSVNLPLLDIPYEGNYTTLFCIFLHLAKCL